MYHWIALVTIRDCTLMGADRGFEVIGIFVDYFILYGWMRSQRMGIHDWLPDTLGYLFQTTFFGG